VTPPTALDTAAELAGLAWFRVDAERRLTEWSPGAAALTGYSAAEVLGMPCVVGIRCETCLSGCGVFEHGEVREVPVLLHRKHGGPVAVLKSGRVERSPGGERTGGVEVLVPADSKASLGAPGDAGASGLERMAQALGRVWIAADDHLRIVRVSAELERLTGPNPRAGRGQPLAGLLGAELFGPESAFGAAVRAGRRREGWRGELLGSGDSKVAVSVSAGRMPKGCPDGGDILVMVRPERPAGHGDDVETFEGMVGKSAIMQRLFRLIELLRGNDATVLITGQSGTGKELVARALHARSHRAHGPFVAVNCGALPADLLESELFGHVRGAFTGATRDRPGRFELARGGTLLLDEVGDLPLGLQVKLLRVLQERTYERVGDGRPLAADVRIIAATHVDLGQAVAERRFRDDLYYRLRVVPIEVPPLRDRLEDLEPLIRFVLQRIGQRRGRSLRLSPTAMRRLLDHPWPGNVRELENALEFATAVCDGQTVHEVDLPAELTHAPQATPSPHATVAPAPPANARPPIWTAIDATEALEAGRIVAALEATHYRRQAAATLLGVSRTTLWRKMRELRLDRREPVSAT